MKDNREIVKSEFKYYLTNVARSARRTNDGFNLGKTAVDSFLAFIEPERLFDYNPGKWSRIKSMYDVTSPDEVKQIANELFNDNDFLSHDNSKNQGWRSGALSHYVCFINARSFFRASEIKCVLSNNVSLQQIYYGAPGTGKSHEIKVQTEGKMVIRTTFHPDSDYSTFVGAYKPTTVDEPLMTVIDTKAVPVENEDGSPRTESKIVYEFVEQAFLQAYIRAWKRYAADSQDGKAPEEVYLVIEEINRGNCAQIFGDLFQLLDRGDDGFSEYPVTADKDLQKQLAKAFSDMPFLNAPALCGMSSDEVAVKIRKGEILLLPCNLYIWATMNTSDQSLFPIDSAFKRRWDWVYMPINTRKEQWFIEADNKKYSWSAFLEEINSIINEKTSSEDMQLGFYFCKAKNNIIDAQTFVSKVVFYLWNDVFKDYGFDGEYFADPDGGTLEFRKFFNLDGSINEKKVSAFMRNIKIDDEGGDDVDDENQSGGIMKVSFPDSTIIEGTTTVDVFMKTITKVVSEHGLDAVKNADIKFSGLNIIQDEGWQSDKYVKSAQKQMNGYVLFLNADNKEKKSALDKLSEKLNLGLNVEFVS